MIRAMRRASVGAWSLVPLVIVMLAACSELPELAEGVCGNFVLDPGEDCDDATAGCQQCALTCDGVAAGEACSVPGYTCGVDNLCHAASGEFSTRVRERTFAGGEFALTYVDDDRLADLISINDTSLSVYYGDVDGALTREYATVTPFARGLPVFAHLDDEDSLDILVPTADGIAGYTSPVDVMSPHPFAIDLSNQGTNCTKQLGTPFFVFSIDALNLGVLVGLPDTGSPDEAGKLGLAIIEADRQTACPRQVLKLCDVAAGNVLAEGPDVDVYATAAPADPGAVIAARVGGKLCVAAVQRDVGTMVYRPAVDVTPTSLIGVPATTLVRPVLADLGDVGCPSLVLSDPVPGRRAFPGEIAQGDCTLAPVGLLPELSGAAGVRAIGHLELRPRMAGYGKDALVLETAVFAIPTGAGAPLPLYRSDRPFDRILAGDLDRDGDLDGVAMGESLNRDGDVDDVDVLRRTPTGFVLYRIDTVAPVARIVVGDYDGDGADDIAYTEKIAPQDERLMVAYGTSGPPLAPVERGAFHAVIGLCPVQVADSLDLTGAVQDLVVLDATDPSMLSSILDPIVTILHGSPQRTLQAFLDPRAAGSEPMPDPTAVPTMFGGVIAGDFFADAQLDILAIDLAIGPDADSLAEPLGRLYPLRARTPGQLDWKDSVATKFGDCSDEASSSSFCLDSGRYVAYPLGGKDVVIGVDHGALRHLVVLAPTAYDPATIAATYANAHPLDHDQVSSTSRIRALHVIDLDRDGVLELAASFSRLALPLEGEVRICEIDQSSGAPTACPDLTVAAPELAGWTCVDAVPAQLAIADRVTPIPPATTRPTDLLALCHGAPDAGPAASAAFRIYRDDSGLRARQLFTRPYEPLAKIAFGDVTGDGLGDIVLLRPGAPTSSLYVLPQCAISDLACRGLR